ncbi:gametogenetin-binding protein 2-like isoform X2 [Orussus abietinus]|uniref:gametogenetin-binding protein 2-like isoform X2 n=1 Tax=Orussus abietinus TaxID=222816 RepID=UPI0006258E06|nr:gametogenetin-binding protein 2-like isoform X2 [Orussus abietinus]
MAKLVDIWRDDNPATLTRRQLPLIVDENLTMVMDIGSLGAVCEGPLVRGKQLDEFSKKLSLLTKEEVKASFEVTRKDTLTILDQAVPCVGCRRSVERLFYDLSKSGHPALDPLIVTSEGMLTVKDDILESPRLLCTMLQGHRLNGLVERQPRSKKSRRCALHSLEVQRTKPLPGAWREVWDRMKPPCRQELTLVETDTLDATLDTYLKKHRFCAECRTKVLLASYLLTTEPDPAKERGYVAALYTGIKRCVPERHVHLPTNTDYIGTIIGRGQPELVGRERHAKTLEIAQEEVLTCLGICVAERLHRVHRRLREEETVCKVLAAVAVEALFRNFQMAVEVKQGITQLELLCVELTKEEAAKEQRREKLRIKRKKKKERRCEVEEKENECECSIKRNSNDDELSCSCSETKPKTRNIDRHKLQVLDPKNKGPPMCKCPDCVKKSRASSGESRPATFPAPRERSRNDLIQANLLTKSTCILSQSETANLMCKGRSGESDEFCESCKVFLEKNKDDGQWYLRQEYRDIASKELMDAFMGRPSERFLAWVESMNKTSKILPSENDERIECSSSERSSQDCGYSSEHNASCSSLPSTPEGSEVACSEDCCNHDSAIITEEKLPHTGSRTSFSRDFGGGLSLTQMLENSYSSEDEGKESYIPAEEVLEFKSKMCQVLEKRQELRQTLRKRFAMLCSHRGPLAVPH